MNAWIEAAKTPPTRGPGVSVIVTGSRDFAHRDLVRAQLANLARVGWLTVLVGDCPTGADLYARAWCDEREAEVDLVVFPADWKIWRASSGHRGGGPERNAAMVNSEPKADWCFAFYAPPPALNRGTSGCAAMAREAEIETREFCRTRLWAEVCEGDVVRGREGEAWIVDGTLPRGGFEVSHEGRNVAVRPAPGATVEVIARGEMGRAVDELERAGLGPERVTQGGKRR